MVKCPSPQPCKKLLGSASVQGQKTAVPHQIMQKCVQEGHCQLDQGAAVPSGEKATASLSSASTTTDTAVWRELQWDPAATWVSAADCALLSGQSQMPAVSAAVARNYST